MTEYNFRVALPFGLAQSQISQIWPFWRRLVLKILIWHFGTFLAFLDKFGIKDLTLALMSIFTARQYA